MNSDLKSFARQYLTVVLITLMLVFFVAFLSIPYSLGSTPGDDHSHQLSTLGLSAPAAA
jgi:hypothetical protein